MKVIAIVAHTVDGFISREKIELINWSSAEDKKIFVKETKIAGVVVMGLTTYETIGKPLKDRLNVVLTHDAKRQDIPGILEFKDISPINLVRELSDRGFSSVFIAGGAYTYNAFIKSKLIDELWITVEPLIFGKGISTFTESLYNIRVKLLAHRLLSSNTLQLKYQLKYE